MAELRKLGTTKAGLRGGDLLCNLYCATVSNLAAYLPERAFPWKFQLSASGPSFLSSFAQPDHLSILGFAVFSSNFAISLFYLKCFPYEQSPIRQPAQPTGRQKRCLKPIVWNELNLNRSDS